MDGCHRAPQAGWVAAAGSCPCRVRCTRDEKSPPDEAGGWVPSLPSSLPPSCTLPLFLPAAPEPSRDEVDDDAPRLEGGDEGLNPLVVEEQDMKKSVKDTSGVSRWKKGSGSLSGKAFHSHARSSSV